MFIVFCGIPASGKTTKSKEISEQLNAKLYCFDEYKIEARKLSEMTSHERMYLEIKNDLLSGYDVILDDLNLTLERRTALLSSIQDVKCKKILIVLQTPIEVCIERNKTRKSHRVVEHVIRHLNNRYCQPSLNEGWDNIIFIDDTNKENIENIINLL